MKPLRWYEVAAWGELGFPALIVAALVTAVVLGVFWPEALDYLRGFLPDTGCSYDKCGYDSPDG
jgi:hypothetical protein